jgi:hypothetical protein
VQRGENVGDAVILRELDHDLGGRAGRLVAGRHPEVRHWLSREGLLDGRTTCRTVRHGDPDSPQGHTGPSVSYRLSISNRSVADILPRRNDDVNLRSGTGCLHVWDGSLARPRRRRRPQRGTRRRARHRCSTAGWPRGARTRNAASARSPVPGPRQRPGPASARTAPPPGRRHRRTPGRPHPDALRALHCLVY